MDIQFDTVKIPNKHSVYLGLKALGKNSGQEDELEVYRTFMSMVRWNVLIEDMGFDDEFTVNLRVV